MSSTPDNPGEISSRQPQLSDEEQLAQLTWYMEEHYPAPDRVAEPEEFDGWAARLPDRLTHAAMMVLGTAAGHQWPGVALSNGVEISALHPAATEAQTSFQLLPPNPRGIDVLTCTAGGPQERSMAWLPDLAALAAQTGLTLIDVPPAHLRACLTLGYLKKEFSAVIAEGPACEMALQAVEESPNTSRITNAIPALLLQPTTALEIPNSVYPVRVHTDADHLPLLALEANPPHVEIVEYPGHGKIFTPTIARRQSAEAAEWLNTNVEF